MLSDFQNENSEDEIEQEIAPLREKAEIKWKYMEADVRWHK